MALLTEPKMVRYIGNGQVKDTQAGKDFLNWIYRIYEMGDGLGLMVLEKKDDRTPVGHAGLVPQTIEGKTEMEIGYWISREHWGNGYATEAAKTLLENGKQNLQLERFIALIQPANIASQHVAKK